MSAKTPMLESLDDAIAATNEKLMPRHERGLEVVREEMAADGVDAELAIKELMALEIAAPSWALGAGGTRFGRFSVGGEPTNLLQKIEDISALRQLTSSIRSISLHIPWDTPNDVEAIKQQAAHGGLSFAAINSNTFHDQPGQDLSYKFGSMSHTDEAVREQTIEHNLECIRIGRALGSKALSVWLSDGSNHPGQQHFRRAADRVVGCLQRIYKELPQDWAMYTEHKPFEPAFYSTVVSDWGASLMIAREVGERCLCLVDLGHHLQGCNIEQIVGYLLRLGRLGGFHFNDAKYADDDLTTGSLRPYMLFLIFHELVEARTDPAINNPPWMYMIDQSHNVKDPLEDLIQSVIAVQRAKAQALIVDTQLLGELQEENDVTMAQELMQRAYRTHIDPLVREARLRMNGALDPLAAYRAAGYRARATAWRGSGQATGL